MIDYKGFKFWLVGTNTWRIQFPGGHKTPPLVRENEQAIKDEIDSIITSFSNS